MQVLVYVLQNTLKLAHPFMPFITEELWQAIPNNSEALIAAEWPREGSCIDADSIESFESFQAAIRAVRNARAEYEVEPGKKIAATVVTSSPSLCEYFNEEIESLALLAKLDKDQLSVIQGNVRAEDKTDAQQIELVVKEGLEVILPLSGLFDPAKEIDRLEKQGSKITKELEGLSNRLSNKNFVDKAPKHVVDEVQAAAKELSDQLAAINEKIENFKSM
jgi:valyl-tRNA synthetase